MLSRFLLVLKMMSVLDIISCLVPRRLKCAWRTENANVCDSIARWTMNEWMNKWKNEKSCMREQQTCPPTIYFNMWTVSSDVSIQRRRWQPLSVHLWSYSTHLTHDVNDVMCVGWPHHRGLRPLLFSNSGVHVGSFMYHKNQISVSTVRRDLQFFLLPLSRPALPGALQPEPTRGRLI